MGWVDRWCLTVGDSHGGTRGGNAGGTLRVVWGLELPCIVGNGVVTRMRLWDRLGVGVGALDAANISDNFLMVSMIWAKKTSKGWGRCGVNKDVNTSSSYVCGCARRGHYGHVTVMGKNSTVFAVSSACISIT